MRAKHGPALPLDRYDRSSFRTGGNDHERLESRASDGYGNTEEERRKVRELIAAIEALLRQSADYEITTTRPVGETSDEIIRACARHTGSMSM